MNRGGDLHPGNKKEGNSWKKKRTHDGMEVLGTTAYPNVRETWHVHGVEAASG